jgi:hypothetical protein
MLWMPFIRTRCLQFKREYLIEVRAGFRPKRDMRANEEANPDCPYLPCPPEDDSQDRLRTVDGRR